MTIDDILNIPEEDKIEIERNYNENASYGYAIEPGALIWDDEIPDNIETSTYLIIIMLLAIRERMYLGIEVNESAKKFWNCAKANIKWPGFKREELNVEQKEAHMLGINSQNSE